MAGELSNEGFVLSFQDKDHELLKQLEASVPRSELTVAESQDYDNLVPYIPVLLSLTVEVVKLLRAWIESRGRQASSGDGKKGGEVLISYKGKRVSISLANAEQVEALLKELELTAKHNSSTNA